MRKILCMDAMWVTEPGNATIDSHAAFLGRFSLAADGEAEIRLVSPGPSLVWIDNDLVLDGPFRFPLGNPEYGTRVVHLRKGEHRIAVQAHYEGVTTRISQEPQPMISCGIHFKGQAVELDWLAAPLVGFTSQVRRVNPQLGWIEWCDTRQLPARWREDGLGESAAPPRRWPIEAPKPRRANIAPPRLVTHSLHSTAEWQLAERFGYARDDPAARFFLRDLECAEVPPQGLWRRYDLGRVRLGRPRFVLDLPAGAVVEFALSESLEQERVCPWITLSDGPSCNLDHYTAHGGPQEFMPVAAKGGRFLEIHVLSDGPVSFIEETFVERLYHGEPEGAFRCGDSLLNRIWAVGVETYRACSEDSLVDNPTRERGQWTGDVVTVGMDIASVSYSDLRLLRRGLVQSAACANESGLVAGLCPGGPAYLSTYAAQWVTACVHYWELTGDKSLLEDLYAAALENLAAFRNAMKDDGSFENLGWSFIDWGYVIEDEDRLGGLGLSLHVLLALEDMVRWCRALNDGEEEDRFREWATWLRQRLKASLSTAEPSDSWTDLGLHRLVLASRAGVLEGDAKAGWASVVKDHYLRCFPNNADAPRLSDPGAAQRNLITPYFSHYALAELWERGEAEFVLHQYRTCWGWALKGGRTTWLEVFDPRWSHCHQWSGCPTWQLTRYVLGFRPRFDLGDRVYVFRPFPTSLGRVAGRLPIHGHNGLINIEMESRRDHVSGTIWSDVPIRLLTGRGELTVREPMQFEFPPDQRIG